MFKNTTTCAEVALSDGRMIAVVQQFGKIHC